MKPTFRIALVAFAVAIFGLETLPTAGQTTHPPGPDVGSDAGVVIQISKALLRDSTRDTFRHVSPVERMICGVHITGTATATGHAKIDFETVGETPAVVLTIHGTTVTQTVGRQGKVHVHTIGTTEFTAVKRIVLEGDRFVGRPTEVDLRHHTDIQKISSAGRGLRQKLVERFGRPKMEYVKEEGDRLTRGETIEQVRANVDQQSGHLAALLNDVAPLRAALASLVPEAKAWRFRFGASDSHLVISISPNGHAIPAPPAASMMTVAAPIQFWIHGNISDLAARDIIEGCARVNDVLRERQRKLPDGSSPIEGIAAACSGDWLVIRVGQSAIEVVQARPEAAEKAHTQTASDVKPPAAIVPANLPLATTRDKVTSRMNPRFADRMRRPSD